MTVPDRPTDEDWITAEWGQWVQDTILELEESGGSGGSGGGTGDLSGLTEDTDEAYRIVLYSNGSMRAIPVSAIPPTRPTGLVAAPTVNSVKLTWTAVGGATQYLIYRDGVYKTTVPIPTYRDGNVTVGVTYAYNVVAENTYGLRSDHSANVSAFVNPALNSAPTIEVTTYPAGAIALGSKAIVRVNAYDVDAQVLAKTLSTDVGSLVATADPSVWILDPV